MVRKISLWAVVILAVTLPLSAGGYYTVTQADLEEEISPLEGNVSAEDFYDYDEEARLSQNPLVEDEESYVFLYRDPEQRIHLFIIHGPSGPRVDAEFRIVDVPATAEWMVQDDPPDVWPNHKYDLAGERAEWSWGGFWMGNRTAGGVLGHLGEGFELHLTPEKFPETHDLYFLSGDVARPDRIELNRSDTITLAGSPWKQPTARLDLDPIEPRVREEVVFDAGASEHDPALELVEFHWDFGDGTPEETTTEPRVRHTYMEGGTYEVALTVVDSEGGRSDPWTFLVDVEAVAVSATRSISTTEALPDSTFRVSVRIRAEQDLAGAGLEESLPVGWDVTPVENAGALFRRPDTQWVFMDQIRAGSERVITYDVTVPKADELRAQRLAFSIDIRGHFQAKTPDFEIEVEGESRVKITDCLSIVTAIAHLIPASQPSERDGIDLRLSEEVTAEQLKRAGELWRKDLPVPDTCGERMSLSQLKELTAHAELCTPVDEHLPEMPWPELRAVRTIMTPIPCQGVVLGFQAPDGEPLGNKFTVKVEITPDVDVYGVGLDEELPSGWRVTPLQNDGFVYKAAANQWAFMGTLEAGRTKTIIYEVEVPPTTPIDEVQEDDCSDPVQRQVVGRADSGWPCVEVDVRGDEHVDIGDCLAVIVAISRWDVKEDSIDLLLSDNITYAQVQRAVAFWLEGEAVPRTCYPNKVDYETLKEIVARWLTETPICEELPGAPPEVCEGD
ncbi:MAG: PKD domain-containing protein [Candidatus Bipolaricaulota bacterium]